MFNSIINNLKYFAYNPYPYFQPRNLNRPISSSYYPKTSMQVVTIPVLSDNYSYLLIDENSNECAAIDCVEADKVFEAAKTRNLEIVCIITTHHHLDHSGGNLDMISYGELSNVPVYGGDERIQGLTNKVGEGDTFQVGNITIDVFESPCHTSGHVLYLANEKALFTGDTLFVGGCGRFFEGTPEQMNYALNNVISNLKPDTEVYCGHEYTKKNLEFALSIEPKNQILQEKYQWVCKQRRKNLPTIPSLVSEELNTNPFLRVKEETVKENLNMKNSNDIEIMAELRKRKDNF